MLFPASWRASRISCTDEYSVVQTNTDPLLPVLHILFSVKKCQHFEVKNEAYVQILTEDQRVTINLPFPESS